MITAESTVPGMHVRDHEVSVPLDWANPTSGEALTFFAREIVDPVRRHEDLPVLVHLQGGPGGKGPRPTDRSGWLDEALKTHRVVLTDQRGTGRSSRVTARTMSRFADATDPGAAGADFLAHFRADSIVRDHEHLRTTVFGGKRWHTLGQSYGGFITMTYLSRAPEALASCVVTGGLPSLEPDALEVYRRTYPRVEARTRDYFARYPQDRARFEALADRLDVGDVLLPDGDVLTTRRVQSLGIDLGMGPGCERMHWLLDEALDEDGEVTDTFLGQVLALSSYAESPLFAAVHESIYGHGAGATAWAAQQVRDTLPQFAPEARPLLFTGEMIYPWMFREIRLLRPFEAAAEALAARTEWSELYDVSRLAANDVPTAAVVYHDDMFVDSGLSLATAGTVGNLRAWVTNEYEHDGLRVGNVYSRLRSMIDEMGGPKSDD